MLDNRHQTTPQEHEDVIVAKGKDLSRKRFLKCPFFMKPLRKITMLYICILRDHPSEFTFHRMH